MAAEDSRVARSHSPPYPFTRMWRILGDSQIAHTLNPYGHVLARSPDAVRQYGPTRYHHASN